MSAFNTSMTAFEIGERLGITPESAQHVMEELDNTQPDCEFKTDDEYLRAIRNLYRWMSDTRGT